MCKFISGIIVTTGVSQRPSFLHETGHAEVWGWRKKLSDT